MDGFTERKTRDVVLVDAYTHPEALEQVAPDEDGMAVLKARSTEQVTQPYSVRVSIDPAELERDRAAVARALKVAALHVLEGDV